MWRGLSLANKVLLIFGAALLLTLLAALFVPWFRMYSLVDDGQLQLSRQLVDTWERLDVLPGPLQSTPEFGTSIEHAGIGAIRLNLAQAEAEAQTNPFVATAVRYFESDPEHADLQSAEWKGLWREYRYARALRDPRSQAVTGVVLLQRRPIQAFRLLVVNAVYVLSAGVVVLGLAVAAFYYLTHRIILNPVRLLTLTAERIREGDLGTRSDIRTGDEFEALSETFNAMIAELLRSQDQLRSINSALDVKLGELAQANSLLYESARMKGEFLASVSHELRTPLNSIIGFAELMKENAVAEQEAGDDSTRLQKRVRYLENIVNSSRGLLEMINSLLEMARIEAGKATIQPGPVDLREACSGLLGLIAPLADKKGIELVLEAARDLPTIETDLKKFQQVIFNFLSNAVKFTPAASPSVTPRIVLRAEVLPVRGPDGAQEDQVRISVIDSGPGIAPEDQSRLFQKFTQLDGSHTREHTGTGLGLAISKDLAAMLQGELQLVSEPGRGSMFSLILPVKLDPAKLPDPAAPGRPQDAEPLAVESEAPGLET